MAKWPNPDHLSAGSSHRRKTLSHERRTAPSTKNRWVPHFERDEHGAFRGCKSRGPGPFSQHRRAASEAIPPMPFLFCPSVLSLPPGLVFEFVETGVRKRLSARQCLIYLFVAK